MPALAADRSNTKLNKKVERAADRKERVIVKRGAKPVAAIVPYEDLQKLRTLERLIERLEVREGPVLSKRLMRLLIRQTEDQMDIAEARRRLADPTAEPRPLAELRAKLGF